MRKSLSLSSLAWLSISLAMVLAFMPRAHAALTFGATTVTTDGALTIDGVATSAYTIGASTTTGTITIGGTAQTGATTFQSVNATGATTSSSFVFSSNSTTTGTASYLVANGLTTGTALGVSSSGTIVTTGELVDFTASGATTSTGVVRITAAALTSGSALTVVGSAPATMTTGAFIRVNDGTTDVFKVNENGHIATATAAAPAIGTVTGVGGGTITITGSDTKFRISNGTNFTNATGSIDITFNQPYGTAPVCTVTAADAEAMADIAKVFVTTSTTTATLNFGAAATANQQTWNFICME